MSSTDNRGRRPSGSAKSPRTRRPRTGPAPSGDTDPDAATPTMFWMLVDGWVRDPKVRRDALIGLGMVLLTLVCAVAALTGWAAPLLHQLLANTIVQIAGGAATIGGLGYGGLRRLRRQRTTAR